MLRKQKAQFTIDGNVKIYSFPASQIQTYQDYLNLKDKEKYLIREGNNLIVNTGLNLIRDLITAATTGSVVYNGVGSSSQAVAATDTDLITAIGSRLAVTSRYSGGTGIAKFDTFYGSTDNNGTWQEAILAKSSSGADAFARKTFTSFVKATTNTATVSWTITMTAV